MADLKQDIQEIKVLKDKFKEFIHGGLNQTISTNSGTWPSIPKAIAEATQTAVEGVETFKNEAQAAAGVAVSRATSAENSATDAAASKNAAELAISGMSSKVEATAADRVQTGLDVEATAADRVKTGLDVEATAADRVKTGLDVEATAADRVQTGLDVVATAADRVQTGLDVAATAADRAQTGLDVAATAEDLVKTGLNVVASAENKIQTGSDKTQTGSDVTASATNLNAARAVLVETEAARDKAQQSAAAVTSGLFFSGGWDASSGNPPPTPTEGAPFYRVTVAGVILGESYTTKDEICYDPEGAEWFRIGGTSGVSSVNGQTGIATLSAMDVGALPAASAGTVVGKNVAVTGDASANEVVIGNDTRLSDSRAPTAHGHAIAEIPGLVSSLASKLSGADIADNLTTPIETQLLSAKQGAVLKGLIDAINALLVSDDVSLDQLQEIVSYVKANRTDIDALGISSVIGLQAALSAITGDITAISSALDDKADKSELANVGISTATLMKFGAI